MVNSAGRALLLGLVVTATGCSDVHETPDAPPAGPAAYTGVWHATGGDAFGAGSGQVQYLELAEDGTGALRTSYEPYGVLGCGLDIFHVDFGGGLFSMDLGTGGARLFRYENPDPDHLVIADQQDHMLSFERVPEVPASAKCRDLASTSAKTDIRPAAGSWSGLAFQSSSSIWYTDNNYVIHSVNPTTGVVTPAAENTEAAQYHQVQAFVGANYWAHCACGAVQDIKLFAPGGSTVVETLDTAILGNQVVIYGVAADTDKLWVSGYGGSNNTFRILKIMGAGGQRTVADSFDFAPLGGIAALDGKLWGLSQTGLGSVLIDIDLTTHKAAATYQLPPTINWNAISAGSGSLWLFGTEPDGDGQLLRVTP